MLITAEVFIAYKLLSSCMIHCAIILTHNLYMLLFLFLSFLLQLLPEQEIYLKHHVLENIFNVMVRFLVSRQFPEQANP